MVTHESIPGLYDFLKTYHGMVIIPTSEPYLTLKGMFDFSAEYNGILIEDSYNLCIKVPYSFPKQLPVVKELDNRIPPFKEFHAYKDGSFCYGSPLRLQWIISKNPSLNAFAKNCLVHYLYAVSYKLKFKGKMPFELAHGLPGQLNDYIDLFGLKNIDQVKKTLNLLGMKKRLANKYLCPCGCSLRLGKCRFNYKIRRFRYLANRSWFKSLTKK